MLGSHGRDVQFVVNLGQNLVKVPIVLVSGQGEFQVGQGLPPLAHLHPDASARIPEGGVFRRLVQGLIDQLQGPGQVPGFFGLGKKGSEIVGDGQGSWIEYQGLLPMEAGFLDLVAQPGVRAQDEVSGGRHLALGQEFLQLDTGLPTHLVIAGPGQGQKTVEQGEIGGIVGQAYLEQMEPFRQVVGLVLAPRKSDQTRKTPARAER